ncbi:MAG: MATE family efflux transporter [Clostridia bacterium]|nr:MATE family efflux transporter [Clostridia bacterium]
MNRYKRVLGLSFPIIISYISFHILGIADVVMVGSLGKNALASVGIALTVFSFFVMAAEGFFDSATILLSNAYGANNMKEFKRYLLHELGLAAVIGIVGMGFYFPLSLLLGYLTNDPSVVTGARSYLGISFIGLAPYLLTWVLMKFMMAIHENKKIAWFSNIAVVLNIILNYIFIFGKLGVPAMGIQGSAWATVITRFLCFAVFGIYCYGLSHKIFKEKYKVNYSYKTIKEIFSLGFPIAQTNLLEVGSWTLFIGVIGRLGTASLAAHEVCMKIKDVAFLPGLALSNVTTTLVGRAIGQRDEKEARAYCYTTAWISILVMGSLSIAFLIIPEQLIGLITKDREVIDIGTGLLRIMALYQISDAIFINFRGGLNGVGDTKFVRTAIMIGGWVIMLPLAYLFTTKFHFGVAGAWIGLTIYVTLIGLVLLYRFIKTKWVKETDNVKEHGITV